MTTRTKQTEMRKSHKQLLLHTECCKMNTTTVFM